MENDVEGAPTEAQTLEVQVNGESRTCTTGLTVYRALTHWNLNPRLIAVEYNGEILHRQFWETTPVQAGDSFEVVTIVGGG
ncbi:MAG: sulfur carrier protein ThiS [Cyanobacteria bacterium P01_F01_bin.153]